MKIRMLRFGGVLLAAMVMFATFLPGATHPVRAAATDLIISEYVEGTGVNDQAIEIYNGTGASVNLTGYRLEVFGNTVPGSPSATYQLSTLGATIPNDGVFVIANPSANPLILDAADDEASAISWSGNDLIAIYKNGTGFVDVIGQMNSNPGLNGWTVGSGSTVNHTLIRNPDVCTGDSNENDAFTGNGEWTAIPMADPDPFADLGFHTSTCLQTGTEPDVIVSIEASSEPIEVDDTVTYTFTVTNQGDDDAENVELSVLFDGTAAWSFDSTPAAECLIDIDELLCDVGTVVNGVPYQTTIDVLATSAGNILVDAFVFADEPEIDTNNDDSVTTTVNDPGSVVCDSPTAEIYDLQEFGSNFGQPGPFTVVGIVTGDFQGAASLDGFYIQDATGDGNTNTSDGIFVYDPDPALLAVTPGQRVEVTGTVSEFNTLTEITATAVVDCGDTGTITPTAVSLPIADLADWENYEGMLVTLSGSTSSLTVTETFNLGRFGEVVVSNGVLFNPTEREDPGSAGYQTMLDLNERSRIIIDDALSSTDLSDLPYLHNTPETLRRGDTTTSITGILEIRFGDFRVQPTQAVTFTPVNTRTTSPASVGGNVKVASFNVLNYFTTLDNGSNGARGADSAIEFDRQEGKIVTALAAINADVFGLMEIENNGTAVNDLVSALNAEIGGIPYAAITTGVVGTDGIAVAMIYKPATVTPVGSEVTITTGPFADLSRPPIAQVFEHNPTGELFMVVVNHFKSKNCGGATGNNADLGDGQSCYNQARVEAATALDTWLDTDPTGTGVTDVLIIGDLNAYTHEDPITTLEGAGYVNLTADMTLAERYSYVFEGGAGVLDHALATASLEPKVTGVTIWKINSDEPRSLDYNDNISDNGSDIRNNDTSLYVRNPYRASDHDPVVVGLNIVETGDPEPGEFALVAPVDNIFIRSLQNFPSLKWTPSLNATDYDVNFFQLSGNTRLDAFTIPVTSAACNATECSLTLTPEMQDMFTKGTYVWTVIAISGAETLEASNAGFRFVLNTGEIELIKNTGFEGQPTNTKVPAQWFRFGKYVNDKIRCDSETQIFAHTGSCAYVLTGAKNEGTSGIRQTLKVGRYRLVAGDKLAMSAWVTQKSGKSGQVVMLLTVTYKNKKLGNNGKTTALIKLPANATPGYVEMIGNREITLAGAVKSIVVSVQYGAATAQVYIDDVSVVILPVDTPAPLGNDGEITVPEAPAELRGSS